MYRILASVGLSALAILGHARTPYAADSFTCTIGRPACLGYGDKVVDQNAVCFASYTCSFAGFVCKSDFDALGADYDRLVSKYNNLVDDVTALEKCVARAKSAEAAKACL
jgi:hypothetical protein